MVRLSRLADYAVVLMTHIASRPEGLHTAAGLSQELLLPQATVAKLMQALSRAELLVSQRGVKGGYALGRSPHDISLVDIVNAVEGPIALTECIEDAPGACDRLSFCATHRNWQIINSAVRDALSRVSLAEMTAPIPVPVFHKGDAARRAGAG